jgi:hypothetical protein
LHRTFVEDSLATQIRLYHVTVSLTPGAVVRGPASLGCVLRVLSSLARHSYDGGGAVCVWSDCFSLFFLSLALSLSAGVAGMGPEKGR